MMMRTVATRVCVGLVLVGCSSFTSTPPSVSPTDDGASTRHSTRGRRAMPPTARCWWTRRLRIATACRAACAPTSRMERPSAAGAMPRSRASRASAGSRETRRDETRRDERSRQRVRPPCDAPGRDGTRRLLRAPRLVGQQGLPRGGHSHPAAIDRDRRPADDAHDRARRHPCLGDDRDRRQRRLPAASPHDVDRVHGAGRARRKGSVREVGPRPARIRPRRHDVGR